MKLGKMTKKAAAMLLVAILCFALAVSAAAAYQFLIGIQNGIGKISSTKAAMSGFTQCGEKVDEVEITMQLQQFKNGSWSYYSPVYTFSATNKTAVDAYMEYPVERGCSYRVISGHKATKNGVSESTPPLVGNSMAFP